MKRKILPSLSLVIVLTLTGFISESYQEMKGNFLSEEIKQIEGYVQFKDSLNMEVSEAPIGWHLDHILLVINNIYKDILFFIPYKVFHRSYFISCFSLTMPQDDENKFGVLNSENRNFPTKHKNTFFCIFKFRSKFVDIL